MSEYNDIYGPYPMRIQVMPGSEAEHHYYRTAARYSDETVKREALAPGVTASPRDDLVFRGGKTVPEMGFQNVYLGRPSDFQPGDVESIDDAISRIILDERLKEIIQQSISIVERDVFTQVLQQTGGNKAKAARLLQVDYKTIHVKVKKLGIWIDKGNEAETADMAR